MAIAIVFILSVLGGLPAVAGADDLPPAACGAAQLPCEPSNENDLLLQVTSSPQSKSSGGLEGNLGSAPAAPDDDATEDELTHEFKEVMDADGSGSMELGEIETLEKELGVPGGIPWRRHDADRDGKLSKSEFVALAKEGAIEDDHNASLLEAVENEEGPLWTRTIRWGDQVALSITSHYYKTGNCGWFGCRVAVMNSENTLQFGHGSALDAAPGRFGQKAGGFYLQPMPGRPRRGCVKWGDQVAISITAHRGKTGNCGWYGCRVALRMRDGPPRSGKGGGPARPFVMRFGHGKVLEWRGARYGERGAAFYVQPMPPATGTVATRKGCVNWGDQFALSTESRNIKTSNCGWYGCRVAFMNPERKMQFGHGSALDAAPGRFGFKPGGWYMRPHPGQRYCAKSRKCAKVGELRSCAWRIACSRGAEDALARVKAKAKATLGASGKAKAKVRAKAIKWASSAPIEESR